jgi:hypothetical protein
MAEDTFALARSVLVKAIRPALQVLERGGLAAEQLLLGTGIQESLLRHRQQLGGGPALGLFQMEPATHDDCWQNFLAFQPALAEKVKQTLEPGQHPVADTMTVNDRYAAAMCRIRYLRVSAPLPAPNDIQAMANYWKAHYNTPLGAGTPEAFLEKWPQYVNDTSFA